MSFVQIVTFFLYLGLMGGVTWLFVKGITRLLKGAKEEEIVARESLPEEEVVPVQARTQTRKTTRAKPRKPTQAKPGKPTQAKSRKPTPASSSKATGPGIASKPPDVPSSQPARTETALWGYMVLGPVVMAGTETDEDLKQKIRRDAAGKSLDVVFHSADEWDGPKIGSISKEGLASAFPLVLSGAQAHMARMGLPPMDPQKLVSTAEVKTNPASGTLIFVFRVQQPVKPEGDRAGGGTQEVTEPPGAEDTKSSDSPPQAGPPMAPAASKGVDTLVELCTGMGILLPDGHVTRAVGELP